MSHGYVTDVPYVRAFVHELAPAWLDHAALVSGLAPPQRHAFAWCDLGCGQGVTAAVLAATHPAGRFHGIDAMPGHIENARRLAVEAGIANVTFHAADFATAVEIDLPKFDYIVGHGVYSWVAPQVRADIRSFVDRHLAPGGLVYVSYNAMPGHAADLPLQRLLRAIGESCPGDSRERVAAALTIVDRFLALKAPALVASPTLAQMRDARDRLAWSSPAHGYMGQHWNPLWVSEVRADLAGIGLKPVGSATLIENHDAFVLGSAAREALAAIDDPDIRELARDVLIDQVFRRDLYARQGRRLTEDEQRRRLLAGAFALMRPAGAIEYTLRTAAGRLGFDNASARAIVAALAAGPRRLGDLAEQGSMAAGDMVANAVVLCASNQIRPVEATPAPVAAV